MSNSKNTSSNNDYGYITGLDHALNDAPKSVSDHLDQATDIVAGGCHKGEGSKAYGEGYAAGVEQRDGKKK